LQNPCAIASQHPAMSTQTSSSSRHGRRPFTLLALSVLWALAGAAHALETPEEPSTAATAQSSTPHPWWTAFHESTLDVLLADDALAAPADREQLLATQATVTSLYVKARVYSIRLATARALRETATRQSLLLAEQGRGDTDLARAVATMAQGSVERERELTVLRSDSVAGLAEMLGRRYPAKALALLLEPALAERRLPVAEFAIPESVSGLVLRQRPDVMAAEAGLAHSGRGGGVEQLRLAEYLQAISSEIGAAPPADLPVDTATQPDRIGKVLQHARAEIAASLSQLSARAQSANRQVLRVQELATTSQQALQDYAAGRISEVDLLSIRELLLLEEDRLAGSLGLTALAWVAFEQSIGGAGQARTSDLLGAGDADE
jgi:hypothetical protein